MAIVYRFFRDLRLDDHAGLAEASKHGTIVPALVLDDRLTRRIKSSPRRAAFFCGAVSALDSLLRERGSRLVVRRGELPATVRQIARESGAHAVAWSASYDDVGRVLEQQMARELEDDGLRAVMVHDAPAIPPTQTTAAHSAGAQGYRSLAPYLEVWKACEPALFEAPLLLRFTTSAPWGEPVPAAPEFGVVENDPSATPQEANAKLQQFLTRWALQYSIATNIPSAEGTSRLSTHLSFGTISARTVLRATLERCHDSFLLAEERASLKRYLRSIATRDFFLQLRWYHPQTHSQPLQEKMRNFTFASDHPQLGAWLQGRTGFHLIDAGVRQLRQTGWMHPGVRAVAASFLCFDLGVDWKIGREEWDRYLVEDDEALATGNWQWIGGVGADMVAYPRIYNPQRQALRFDPAGQYVRRWLEEVRGLPGDGHARSNQSQLPLFAPTDYAPPIVDHAAAAREFLDRYTRYVKQADVDPASH
ncbi:MAG: DNA photolyase family protein [Candidatus Eremiobacteraeota bacterium]|nr:DNA photolyase family protein [Candidatus Eremiobacteraeota bacterium]